MKKTKLLTSLVALALVVSLGACEVNADVGDDSDTTDTEPSEPSEPSSSDTGSTPSESSEDTSSSSSTPEEPPVVTHEYSIEVENADALKELTYDGNATTQQGVQLSIYLVDTPSEGEPTKEAATENDVTFTVVDSTVVTVSGLTVLPLKEGSTSITIAWASNATTSVDVLVTDITVNESEGPTSWNECVTNELDRESIAALFGSVEILDEILPFYSDTEPASIVTGTHYQKGDRLIITYNSDVLNAWVSLLTNDGWEQTDHTTSYISETYTFEKDGYTVELELEYGTTTYVYLYPKAETGEEGGEDLETAQAILNVASAISSTGYNSFEYLYYDSVVSEYSGQQITENKYHLTLDENNTTNKIYGVREQIDDKTSHKYHYFYDGTDYYINASSVPSINGSVTATNFGSLIGPNVGTSSYNGAFDNVSSISLSTATDVAVEIEENGNYCLTLIYNDVWYCYKATADFELVGAGYAVDYNTADYSIYYGESISAAEFNEAMADFDITLWIPDYGQEEEASDDEIAQEILDAADNCDTYGLDWDAFHGEYIDESMDETDTLYLTTDSDGLYGSGICLDDGDPDFEYYYKNGKEYVHNSNYDSYSINESSEDFYYGETYDEIFDDFTSDALGDAFLLDLDDDDWTLTTLSDGYELVVETTDMVGYHMANVEYVYITDLDYNLLAVAYGVGTAGSDFEGWYAEQATTAQVEASLAGFDPANWGEGGDDPSNPGSGSGTVVDSDSIEDALSLLLEYGADTSSWSGVAFQDVIDYSENMYGFLNIDLEKFDETILATENDGVVTGLDEDLFYLYGELYADYSEYEYYDGTTLHSLDYGSYSSEETSLDLSYFTSYPLSQVQYDIAYLTQFSGLTAFYSYLFGYEFDGGIKVGDDAITVTASVSAYQEGDDDEDYGEYQETLTVSLETVYDLNGGLISSSFSYIDYLYYPSIYSSLTYSQTTTCSNFTGTIDTPTWVVNG